MGWGEPYIPPCVLPVSPPTSLPCPFSSPDATWARPLGKVGGEVKLSISYKNNKLFIMVMHIRGLVGARRPGAGSACGAGLTACPVLCPAAAPPGRQRPRPLRQDLPAARPPKNHQEENQSGPKNLQPHLQRDGTGDGDKVLGGFRGPVAEVLPCFVSPPLLQLVYDGVPRGDLQQRELRLSVLSEEGFWENILLGEVGIRLRDLDLAQEKMGWFALGSRGHGTL